MSSLQIRQRLDQILDYMQPYWELVNCHMVNYITDKHWQRFVPAELRAEVADVQQVNDCIKTVFWQQETVAGNEVNLSHSFPAFEKFLARSAQQRLDSFVDVLTSVQDLKMCLRKVELNTAISIKEFMSEKKRHEVEVTAALVNDLLQHKLNEQQKNDIFVIDAGDGKGYLSSRLALEYGHKVLGIDANETNTEKALERNRKLERAWSTLTERAKLQQQGITPPRRGNKQKQKILHENENVKNIANYKTIAKFITPALDMVELLQQEFFANENSNNMQQFSPDICLTGLHTCGNLAATCLQVFHAQPNCKVICNIGCCYHLLKESYSNAEFWGNKEIMDLQTEPGFPLSQYLHERRIKLGRNARMLAAQSIERTTAAQELPSIALYYRALLEVLICEQQPDLCNTIQVGKIRKFANFKQYVQLCAKKHVELLKHADDARIEQLELLNAAHKEYLNIFQLLRMSFAPILESLILLDRLLYLKELGYEQSYLISLFNAVISPRHFAIVAMKD